MSKNTSNDFRPTKRRPVVELMDPMMVEIMRQKTPEERLAIAFNMWKTARVMIGGTLRQQHPDWTEEQINQEIAKRVSHGKVHQGVVDDVGS